jgi:Subtilase family
MAPDAQLYLVNFDLFTEFSNAVNWLISEKVDVISFSIGYFNAGAGDGSGPVNDVVDQAQNAGIIWVAAAGNEAVSHWRGDFADPDSDGWLNFAGDDETNNLHANAGDSVYAYMNWNDWYESDQDYDLYVFNESGHTVAASTDLQDGSQWPVEGVSFTAPYTGIYHIAVYKDHADKPVKIELFLSKDYPQFYTSASSLTIPADNKRAIAAGATYWENDELEYFSSRGPTKDGRIKPDFTAPDGVSTQSYGQGSFFGTSAATPHLAGAFGLLKEKISQYTNEELKQIVESRSIDYGTSGKDNLYGSGRLYLLPQ